MINILLTIIKVVFLLGFLVLIHEGGHFLVAKLCKVQVNEFAIGFGPTIWRSKNTKTKYALRLIPLGGFVSMLGEEERSEEEGSFSKASIPKRIAIVAAGGTINIIFAIIVYWAIASYTGGFISTKIESVEANYGAMNAGIMQNDVIKKVNGKTVRDKQDLEKEMEKSNGNIVNLEIKRDNETLNINVQPTGIPSKDTGIYLGTQGEEISTEIVALYPDSPAENEGIKVGDIILKIDGKEVEKDPYKVVEYIKQSNAEKIKFTLQRDEQIIDIEVTPRLTYTYVLGVQLKEVENTFLNNIYYGFWDTTEFTTSIIDNLKILFTGKVSTDQLMGPIGISNVVASTQGILDYIYILALVSLSLGVTNLLPFPPLDGGKIVIYLIEAIRRKPIKENVEIGIQMVGFVLLITLSIYVTYNDVLRIF